MFLCTCGSASMDLTNYRSCSTTVSIIDKKFETHIVPGLTVHAIVLRYYAK